MSATIVRLDAVRPRRRRVAVGKFDGLHLGHRVVISSCDAVCTFDPHPSAELAPGSPPPLLTSLRRRAELLGAIGIDELVVLPFDEAMRARSPQAFIEEVLLDRLGATHVRVGTDFRFGHRAAGGPADLLADDRLRCQVIEPIRAHGAMVSSTRIRALVAAGAVAEAAELLGAPHAIWCRCGPTTRRETELLPPEGLALPPNGTYVVRLHFATAPSTTPALCHLTTHRDTRFTLHHTRDATLTEHEEIRIEFIKRHATATAALQTA